VNVTLVSYFRNAIPYLPRFFAQTEALAAALADRGDHLSLVLGEGDSIDQTRPCLVQWQARVHPTLPTALLDVSHGGPPFGSVVNPLRFRQLAYVVNLLLDVLPDEAERVIYVESDLIWDTDTMLQLLGATAYDGCDIACPMIFASDNPVRMYDIWAYAAHGQNFAPWPPYHPVLTGNRPGSPVLLQTAGSCLVMTADVARRYRLTSDEAIRGFTRQATTDGRTLYLYPTLVVRHP
jgi:hypothetical protein